MKKITVFLVSLLFLMGLSGLSQAETLSLTTYYPAPFGVYNQLRLVPSPDPACNANLTGLLWVNAGGELRYCDGTNVVPPNGVWTQDDNTNMVFLTDMDSGANPNLNVGVGTSSAATRLEVESTSSAVMRVDSTSGGGVEIEMAESNAVRSVLRANATNALELEDNGGGVPFAVTQTGEVGIGTTAPNTADSSGSAISLELASGGLAIPYGSTISIRNQGDTAHYPVIRATGGGLLEMGDVGNVHSGVTFNAGGGARMRLTSPGHFGVNLINPAAKIHVRGDTTVPVFRAETSAGTEILEYDLAGDLRLTNGDIYADAYFYNSDITLKEDIAPAPGLEKIMELEGIQFHWKNSGKADIGLSAQNVETVFPDLVETNPETNLKSVKYGNLIAPLIEAIKEQQKQIETLEKEIKELKGQQF